MRGIASALCTSVYYGIYQISKANPTIGWSRPGYCHGSCIRKNTRQFNAGQLIRDVRWIYAAGWETASGFYHTLKAMAKGRIYRGLALSFELPHCDS